MPFFKKNDNHAHQCKDKNEAAQLKSPHASRYEDKAPLGHSSEVCQNISIFAGEGRYVNRLICT